MPINIVFFGDSVCFGQYVSLHQCWVSMIAHKLSERYNVVVTNSSINGCTTRQALLRMPYDLSNLSIDIIVVQYGMNDANYWETDKGVPRVSPQSFVANLHEIIERAVTLGAKKIFLTTNYPATKKMSWTDKISYQKSNEQYNQLIRNVVQCSPRQVLLIDVEQHFLGKNSTYLLPDFVHLNPTGHQIYFEYVYPIIEKAVKETQCTKSSTY